VDIPARSIQILHDEDQRTAVVIQSFETAEYMAAAEGPLDRHAGFGRPLRHQGRAEPKLRRAAAQTWAALPLAGCSALVLAR
jgi:hypothetical protein